MKFELLLSHWLRVTNIIYAALSSGVLAAVLAFPEFRRILFQSWLVVTDVFQLFLIILLFILLSKIAQLNRIRNGWRNEKKEGEGPMNGACLFLGILFSRCGYLLLFR